MRNGFISGIFINFFDLYGNVAQFKFEKDDTINCNFYGACYDFATNGMYYSDAINFDSARITVSSSYERYDEFVGALNNNTYYFIDITIYPNPYNKTTKEMVFTTFLDLRDENLYQFYKIEEKFSDMNDPSTKYLLFDWNKNIK